MYRFERRCFCKGRHQEMQVELANGFVVEKMDLATVRLREQWSVRISHILEQDGFVFDTSAKVDRRLRTEVYDMLKNARRFLPVGLRFFVGEAYRPLARQVQLWDEISARVARENPLLSAGEKRALCENFIADPYDGIGSGHQAACALDVTLCDADGRLLDMGTRLQEFNEHTRTAASEISQVAAQNRKILCMAMEKAGFVNYPAEWWHYSYGDCQWAWLCGKSEAFFGTLDLPGKI